MITAWMVFSGRWDVFGKSPDDLPIGAFVGSACLAAIEAACELHWILTLIGVE